jgi:UDP-N-acetyl-2-amino-2-deoxyglucuronate dehydrogenase
MTYNFALIGAAGYVAPRHMKAIKDTGNRIVAAADPSDSVGILDSYDPAVRYFPEIERFDRHLEKLRRGQEADRVHYVSICSPNYLHDAHVRLALRIDADAICEKPLVIKPWNLDYLSQLEEESGRRVNTVLQLRVHPSLIRLKQQLDQETSGARHQVVLTYVAGRGSWYDVSWKGIEERSGGVAMNIGVHFFDLLLWLFGEPDKVEVHVKEPRRMGGFLELKKADVRWFLSVNMEDLPFAPEPGAKTTFRSITMDGQEIEFTKGFTDLHTRVYERTLKGNGFTIEDARPSVELVHRIRQTDITSRPDCLHPLVTR